MKIINNIKNKLLKLVFVIVTGGLVAMACCAILSAASSIYDSSFDQKIYNVTCYSAGTQTYTGKSVGNPSLMSSQSYSFLDATTKQLIQVSGQCVITST
jgi:hypothetical protein